MGQFDPQSAVTLVGRDGREIPQERWMPVVAEFVRRLEVLGVDPVRRLPGEAAKLVAAAVDQRVRLARLVDRYVAEARTAREVGDISRAVELERFPLLRDASGEFAEKYGARGTCLYLVRPDRYVGFRCDRHDLAALERALARTFA